MIIKPQATIPEHVIELGNMNRGVWQNELTETIARAIWEEGKAIMGTDGSVQDPIATYLFVISISRTDIKTSVNGGGFLPPTAQPVSSRSVLEMSRSGALLAGLTWIQELLQQNSTLTIVAPTHILLS
jgi:hypothetical protein